MMTSVLHHKLVADTALIGDLSPCRLLLMNNRRFLWLILAPYRKGLSELSADVEITSRLSPEVLKELFDFGYHTKHVDTVFNRVFGRR